MEDNAIERVWNKEEEFTTRVNKFIVWPLGLWPLDDDDIFSWIRIVFCLISQLWIIYIQGMTIYRRCGNAADIVDIFSVLVCAVMSITKILAFRLHMSGLREIFYSASDDWRSIDDIETLEIFLPFIKTGHFAFYMLMGSCYVYTLITITATLPFLFISSATNETSWNNTLAVPARILPLKTECMFEHSSNAVFSFFYVYELISISVVSHGNTGCDVFILAIAMHLCGQIELLKRDLSEIGSNVEEPKEMHQQIATNIQRHSRLLDLIDIFNKAVSGLMLVMVVLNAGMNLVMGIRLLVTLKNSEPLEALRPIIGISVLMSQLYVLSYAGDRLSQQAESVLRDLYDSKWYVLPAKFRRDLNFVAMRANRPVYLTAGKFYVMNLENFMGVLKASFSYFSILKVVFDN